MYCVAMRSVALCGCGTWNLYTKYVRLLEVLDHERLCIIKKIVLNGHVRNVKVGNPVSATAPENIPSQCFHLLRLH